MAQNEKVTVKLTLEIDVKSALINFDDCKTTEDIVDCMVLELNDQFANTGSGITITDADVIKKVEHPHDEMSNEEAIDQLNFMMEIMPKEPPEECDDIDEWLDTDKDIRTTLDMAIEALKQKSCNDIHEEGAWIEMRYGNYDPQSGETYYDDNLRIMCSKCGSEFKVKSAARYHYCPNCGLKMTITTDSGIESEIEHD